MIQQSQTEGLQCELGAVGREKGGGEPDPRPGSSYLYSLCSLSGSKRALVAPQRPLARVRRRRARRKAGRTRSPRRTPCRRRPCSTRTTYPTGRWSSSPSAATSGKGRLRGRRRRNESHTYIPHTETLTMCVCARACFLSFPLYKGIVFLTNSIYSLHKYNHQDHQLCCAGCVLCVCVWNVVVMTALH